jgi:hypothetical protein
VYDLQAAVATLGAVDGFATKKSFGTSVVRKGGGWT